MKEVLRSVFVQGNDNEDLIFKNYLMLEDSGLGFHIPTDTRIHEFVKDFVRTHNHPPAVKTLRSHFTHSGDTECLDRLETLVILKSMTRGDFQKRIEEESTERKIDMVGTILEEAALIVKKGLEIKEGRDRRILLGPIDAVRHVMDASHKVVTPTLGTKLSGEVVGDGKDFLAEYDKRKNDPLAGIGAFSGIRQMDFAIQGAKRGELWTHAAFTGHLKSTLALNWLYNQAIWYKQSGLFFSLEMPYNQVRRILIGLHSYHGKFTQVRIALGLQTDPEQPVSLPYQKIRDGMLSPEEESFMVDYVIPDLLDPANGYGKIHIEVPNPDKSDFTVADLRQRAEVLYSKDPFSMIVVDHMGLMSPRKWVASTTERLNEIVRDLKRLAMSFNRGQGIAVLNLSQINRDGFAQATKKDEAEKKSSSGASGRYYNLTALAYSNEIERSSDVVTATYLNDEHRAAAIAWVQCLKTRDQGAFDPFQVNIHWNCRRLSTRDELPVEMEPSNEQLGAELDAAL